jgi:hypothetical protein
MSSSEAIANQEELRGLSDDDLQRLLALATKEYSNRQQGDHPFPAFGDYQAYAALTATDAVIMASAVIDALGVEIFELGMWRTWGGA